MDKQLIEELLYEYSDLFQLKMKEAEIKEHKKLCGNCDARTYAGEYRNEYIYKGRCRELLLKEIELTNLKSKIKELNK